MANPLLITLLLITPGALILRLTWPKNDLGLMEKFGLSVGLSITMTPLIIALIQTYLNGVFEWTLWLVALIPLVGIFIPIPRTGFQIKFTKWDVLATMVLIFALIFIFANFTKYPYFPRFYSHDFGFHLDLARRYLEGSLRAASATYPPSLHMILAAGLISIGGKGLLPMQYTMALVIALSSSLVYAVSSKVFKNKAIGILAAILYVIVSPMWTIPLQNSGIYSNLISNFVAITLIATLILFIEDPKWYRAVLLFFVSIGLYLTHYTSLLMLPFIIIFVPVIAVKLRQRIRACGVAVGLVVLPALVFAYLRQGLVYTLSAALSAGAPLAKFEPNPLTELLNGVSPFLLFLYLEVMSETLFFFVLVCGIASLVWLIRRRADVWMLLPFVWFFYIFAVSTISPNLAWRFVYNAHAPLVLFLPKSVELVYNGIQKITVRPKLVKKRGKRPKIERKPRTSLRACLVLMLLVAILYNSTGINYASDILNDPFSESFIEKSIMQSVRWIKENVPKNAKFLAITEWKYLYLNVLADRDVALNYYLTPEKAVEVSKKEGIRFVIVTAGKYPGPDSKPTDFLKLYNQSKDFQQVYSNLIVSIFEVKR